jgi:predicted nucleotidyltransferase
LDRAREVRELTERITAWARERPDVRGAALVGSWAGGEPGPDSDLDVLLITDAPDAYTTGTPWTEELPDAELVETRDWGALTERRLRFPSGLEVELGIAPPAWASTDPLDAGTRRVVRDGLWILHDPDRLLADLAAAC